MPPTILVICTFSRCIVNSLTNDDQQVQNGTYVTLRTCQKHQADNFQENSQDTVTQAITNLNSEDDNKSDDTNETIQSDCDVSDIDSESEDY